MWIRKGDLDRAKGIDTPIPTQVVSNEEFIPRPQTRKQKQVEDSIRAGGSAEVPSNEVGLAILGPLRELDEVAYLRFASVYRSFSSAEDFEREIEALRAHRSHVS